MSEELIAERDKVQIMMSQIEAAKGDKVLMMKYISESKALKSKIQKLILQVNLLENTNKNLVAVINTTQTRLIKEEIYADTLKSQNKKMNSKIVNASSLAILNLQSIAIKEKSSGKQIETDKASKADILKISFLIAENKIAKSGDKSYFVQVIDYRGEVLGEKIKESFKSFILSYSFLATVKYENQTVKIEKDLPVSNIKPGIYYINIYDKDEVVARSTFTLK